MLVSPKFNNFYGDEFAEVWHHQSLALYGMHKLVQKINSKLYINVLYGTHQLQLKRDTRGTRKGHACYTRVFLVIYTQLHAM